MNTFTRSKISDFTDINAWKESHEVVKSTYSLTKKFPKEELFCLTAQMRRSAISITSNIAEGFGRHTYRERVHFYVQARGSLSELKNQLIISRDLCYISADEFSDVYGRINISHQLLQGLITKTRSFVPLISPIS